MWEKYHKSRSSTFIALRAPPPHPDREQREHTLASRNQASFNTTYQQLTTPTELQKRAFELLGLKLA